MYLSKKNLEHIHMTGTGVPPPAMFDLPEKILQFGTGVLLRALPDYFVDKANRRGIFNGRILVIKSTDTGDTEDFHKQDNLYSLSVRGIESGKPVDDQVICSAISRVLSAGSQWPAILESAANRQLEIVISNTTEVGVQLVRESILQKPPASFPAKLLAFLFERYKIFAGLPEAGMLIIPTELLPDNGIKLKSILLDLAEFNELPPEFVDWLIKCNRFCSSLVDRIVPGKPDSGVKDQLEKKWGYTDGLLAVCEPYRLWAIEGDDAVRKSLSFCSTDAGVVVDPDITKYRELKLRMLNATHTLSCGLAYLSGFETVRAAMEDGLFETYINKLMMDEICPAIPYPIDENEKYKFGLTVLERFRNPYLQHRWLSITMQYSSKLSMRVLPVLYKYYELFQKPPELISIGFAAFILFMRPVKKESGKYSGLLNNQYYLINDDRAAYFHGIWDELSVDAIVNKVLASQELWPRDLTLLEGFADAVSGKLKGFIGYGTMHEIGSYTKSVR